MSRERTDGTRRRRRRSENGTKDNAEEEGGILLNALLHIVRAIAIAIVAVATEHDCLASQSLSALLLPAARRPSYLSTTSAQSLLNHSPDGDACNSFEQQL